MCGSSANVRNGSKTDIPPAKKILSYSRLAVLGSSRTILHSKEAAP
jgi:hypothetical protein